VLSGLSRYRIQNPSHPHWKAARLRTIRTRDCLPVSVLDARLHCWAIMDARSSPFPRSAQIPWSLLAALGAEIVHAGTIALDADKRQRLTRQAEGLPARRSDGPGGSGNDPLWPLPARGRRG